MRQRQRIRSPGRRGASRVHCGHSASGPTDTLTANMLRQLNACTRSPPRTGPNATPSALALAHAASAFDRAVCLVRCCSAQQGVREKQRSPHALKDARYLKRSDAGSQSAQGRGQSEHRQTAHKDALGTKGIAKGSRPQQRAASVTVDQPLQCRKSGAELRADARQRQIHNGGVEHDHEEGRSGRNHRQPSRGVRRPT